MKITVEKIKENMHLLRKNTLLDFYAKFKDINRVRRAAIIVSCVRCGVCIEKKTEFGCIKIYSDNKTIFEDIKNAQNEDFCGFCKVLISKMKEYHSYIDFFPDPLKDVFAEDLPRDKNIQVFIDSSPKVIAGDPQIQECFEKFSDLLLKKVTASDATLMDVFFMLAYHTIDRIEFRPKEDMTELVAESLEGVSDYADANSECNDGCERAFWEQLEHYIERHGYIDRVHYFDENGGHVVELPRGRGEQFHIEELLGCYIDRSNQNCSLSKDNNIIYLCKEYIEAVASKFDGFNYDLVKNNIMEELWDCDGISYDQMFELVLAHEFGHLAFSYLDYDNVPQILSEGRANFFASYLLNMVDKAYISLIKITTQKQPKDYQKPILITQDKYVDALFP